MNQIVICRYCKTSFVSKNAHKMREHPFCSRICANLSRGRKTNKEYYEKHFSIPGNREKKREQDRQYSLRNREKLRLKAREYFLANKATVNAKQRDYAERKKEEKKTYQIKHKDRMRETHRAWCAKQRKENPLYRLHDNLTSSIGQCLRTGKDGKSAESLLGYTISDLKKHLEKQFLSGMTWENYGAWHVDHIVPLCAFNITSIDDIDFKRAWSLSNLRPLWRHENLVKSGRVDRPFQPALSIAV